VQQFRVFYDIVSELNRQTVKVKAVGHKEHNSSSLAARRCDCETD